MPIATKQNPDKWQHGKQSLNLCPSRVSLWTVGCKKKRVVKPNSGHSRGQTLEKNFNGARATSTKSPLDCKEVQPVHPKGKQSWIFIGRTDAEAETPMLWPPHWRTDSLEKTLMLGKIEGGRRRGQQRMRWLDGITNTNGHEFEWALGIGDGQGSLACCSPWGHKESDMTEQLNWTECYKHRGKVASTICEVTSKAWAGGPWNSKIGDRRAGNKA